jgi:U3 small nucleolar RNA-associated protein 14
MSSSDSEGEDPRFRIPRGASDEDIDSDNAFPDSDDEGPATAPSRRPHGNANYAKAGIPKGHAGNDDKDDDDDDESSEEGILLSEMLDLPSSEAGRDANARVHVSAAAAALLKRADKASSTTDAHGDPDIPDSDDDEGYYSSGSNPTDDDTPEHADLLEAATGRPDFASRRAARLAAVEARRRARKVTTGVGQEGILKAQPGTSLSHDDALALMVGALDGKRSEMGELKRKLGRLVGGDAATGPLDAPLPTAVSARIQRAAAYEKTTEEVSKWTPVVKKNRVAEQLVFPLDKPGGQTSLTSRDAGSSFRASNPFEIEVESLLAEAGVVADADVIAKEEEQLNAMASVVSKEEVLARRRELARMRSVLFMHERKLKRIKKIKSRKFRKMMKIEREKVMGGDAIDGAGEDDPVEGAFAAERQRVVERMTLRHKNTSKWVRRQLSRGEVKRNPATRAAVEEQLRLHEELRRKQEGSAALTGRPSDSDSDVDDKGDGHQGNEALLDEDPESNRTQSRRGLLGLKFMQEAQERRRLEAQDLLNQMQKSDDEDNDSAEDYPAGGRAEDRHRNDSSARITPGCEESCDSGKPSSAGKGLRGAFVGRQVFEGREGIRGSTVKAKSRKHKGKAVPDSDGGLLVGDEEDCNWDAGDVEEHSSASCGRGSETPILGPEAIGNDASTAVPHGYTTTLAGRIEAAVDDMEGSRNDPSTIRFDVLKATRHPQVSKDDDAAGCPASLSENPKAVNPWLVPVKAKSSIQRSKEVVKPLVVPLTAGVGDMKAVSVRGRLNVDGHADEPIRKRVRFDATTSGAEKLPNSHSNSQNVRKERDEREKRPNELLHGLHVGKRKSPGVGRAEEESWGGLKSGLEQMEVVANAFAGAGGADFADFEVAKAAELENSLPSAEKAGAVVLPGWGGWAGEAEKPNAVTRKGLVTQQKPESAFAKAAREKLEAARAEAISRRPDALLRHVVISARRAKMAADLTVATVPFPFVSAAQWEKEVATPLVRERLTHAELEKVVRPRVSVAKGDALQPLRMSAGAKSEIAQMRKLKMSSKGKSGVVKLRGDRATKRDGGRRGLLE